MTLYKITEKSNLHSHILGILYVLACGKNPPKVELRFKVKWK